jgi:hypothetical protein
MYFRYNDYDNYNDYYRVAVKAYTSNLPILVNGTDINVQPYPALNYQPNPTIPPYSYVPIAQFSKVGAKVVWDEKANTIYVTTDYFQIKNDAIYYKQELEKLRAKYDKDTETIMSTEDIEFANSMLMNENMYFADHLVIFQNGVGDQPNFKYQDFVEPELSKHPIGIFVKYFAVSERDPQTQHTVHQYVYLKIPGIGWKGFGS